MKVVIFDPQYVYGEALKDVLAAGGHKVEIFTQAQDLEDGQEEENRQLWQAIREADGFVFNPYTNSPISWQSLVARVKVIREATGQDRLPELIAYSTSTGFMAKPRLRAELMAAGAIVLKKGLDVVQTAKDIIRLLTLPAQ